MSENTVRSDLTAKPRKRAKRRVETAKFDAFARRILRAYARRVADGDIESLRSLSQLSSEIDAVTRIAIAELRKAPYRYSWQEIAARLGVTKQTAHERYGDRAGRGILDRRLLEAGLNVSVATLVQVFADHHHGIPAASVCPGCGYRYPEGVLDCPTNATVRPLLLKRRGEDREALVRLTGEQFEDLLKNNRSKVTRAARRESTEPPTSAYQARSLFDLAGKDVLR